jgi:homocysteine S-methyltransferase
MNLHYPILLDGGLSNELESAGFDLSHDLWSARLIQSHPEAITAAHLAYLKAGAQCIITSSYQASIPGLMAQGHSEGKSHELILKTVKLAEIAVQQYLNSESTTTTPLIAASIGPYGAYLADGSEYHGKYGISNEELRDFHFSRIKLLATSNADLLACETIPSLQEVKVLLDILYDINKPVWISVSCKDDGHMNDGTPIEEFASIVSSHPNIFAMGINCTAPQYVSSLIRKMKACSGSKKIIVYPNSGEVYDPISKSWQKLSESNMFLTQANEWLDLGADIIGGCCQIGPSQIANLRDHLLGGKV